MIQRYDTVYDEDYEEDVPKRNQKKKKGGGTEEASAPEPIIYEDLVEQFNEEYSPASFESEADEQMDIAGLRDYFNAWPPYGYPDAIPVYLDMLRRYGFRLKVNFEHEPVLFLKRNEIPYVEEIEL